MNKLYTILVVAGLELGMGAAGPVFGSGLMAQEPGAIAREPQPAEESAGKAKSQARTIDQCIADLGSDSYRSRLQAETTLRQHGQAAVPALRRAADDDTDNEVQWRARRLLRQIERGADQGLVERTKNPATPDPATQDPATQDPATQDPRAESPSDRARRRSLEGMQHQFDSLFERFERDFGLDVPRARFFQDDFFRDLQAQVEAGTGNSQGMVVQIGPDGAVHVEVNETNQKGEREKKVYDAPDLESFQELHPEVLPKNGLSLGLRPLRSDGFFLGPNLRGWGFGTPGRQPILDPWNQVPAGPDAATPSGEPASPPDGQRLGIYIHPSIPAELRLHLGLEDGVGLMVESVQPGTMAATLGLERGDIVTKIGERSIGSAQDVQVALAGIDAGGSVEVRFLRKGVATTVAGKKPATPAAPTVDRAAKEGKLEPRRGKRDSTIR